LSTLRKKLIEVALPLEEINKAAAKEKNAQLGHPSGLHIWWARRPLAACRAVLFGQLVDDPSSHPDKFASEEAQKKERERLFGIIDELVKWENSNNQIVLAAARKEILKSCDGNPPPVLDPFCGGGSIPLEAQRLGLEAHASDLNPIAVLITKALIEIPPKFPGHPPVNPEGRKDLAHSGSWTGAAGLAEDVRYYGKWMRDEAEKRIGHLYPKVKVTAEMAKDRADLKGLIGKEFTAIAWLWARTVKCPNPACGVQMPLVRSFALSTRKGRHAWVEPTVEKRSVQFDVRVNGSPKIIGTVSRKGAACLACKSPVGLDYVRAEGMAGRMNASLMAVATEGERGRVYLPASADSTPKLAQGENETVQAARSSFLSGSTPERLTGGTCYGYGLTTWGALFTPRQLVALAAFSDLVSQGRERVLKDAKAAGIADDGKGIVDGGLGATAYADAIATYLTLAVGRSVNAWSSLVSWRQSVEATRNTFARQALPMVWDFAEANPFSASCGNWIDGSTEWIVRAIRLIPCGETGKAQQLDATAAMNGVESPAVCTDPPYYDNIGYADLADFFYVWLRPCIRKVYAQLFSTLLVPKAQELVATPYRFGGDKEKAREFFEEGLRKAFVRMRDVHNPAYPLTVFYAFKQAEMEEDDDDDEDSAPVVSTGWETMLEGLIRAKFQITGTWPMRTERAARTVSIGTNSLASSVLLACRTRADDAPIATRREFITALRKELPGALRTLQHGNIAPVDLAQAAIGPGMAVFSRYSKVVETSGEAMRVRTALGLINQALDEVLAEQEGEYDAATRWVIAWFEQFGMSEGPFGIAETLSKAKDVGINGLCEAGIVCSKGGKVWLQPREALNREWDPATTHRLTIWEITQRLIYALETGGESGAGDILRRVGGLGENAKDLAYRLYTICERKGWPQQALPYNMLVKSWPDIVRSASGPGETARLL
jgi:putative DNA methylase